MVGTSWHSYPKIYALGHRATQGILDRKVVVEEKVDGSQFSFGAFRFGVGEQPPATARLLGYDADGGTYLVARSKGQQIDLSGVGRVQKLFVPAVDTVVALAEEDRLHVGWTYRGEAVASVRHNALTYARVPEGNVIIFDINPGHEEYLPYPSKAANAALLGLECVPQLYRGMLTHETLDQLLDATSLLGGAKIEGFVVKPIEPLYGEDGKAVMAKYVSEAFKEVHKQAWKPRGKASALERIVAEYGTEQRWAKAVQHLREDGRLAGDPRDIGNLVEEVQRDVFDEDGDRIRDILFQEIEREVRKGLTRGLAEWYKRKLAEDAFGPPAGTLYEHREEG